MPDQRDLYCPRPGCGRWLATVYEGDVTMRLKCRQCGADVVCVSDARPVYILRCAIGHLTPNGKPANVKTTTTE